MNKEEHFLRNRIIELANISYTRNIYTNTDFLNLNELNILHTVKKELPPVNIVLTGGNDYAERKIAIFSPTDIYYQQAIPISLIKIAPINSQFAEKLSHRDYLGAILNLGINRSKIGDIFIKNDISYLYCMEDICPYILENLSKIRHTLIRTEQVENEQIDIQPTFIDKVGTIGNIRLDSLISTAFGTSRNSIISFIEDGKVFVNGKLVTSNGYSPNEGDIISVRGKGRFIYEKMLGVTKKGRNLVSIKLYH